MSEAATPLRRVSNVVVGAVLRLWGLRVTGLENVPETGPVIFAGNHVSNLDGPMLAVAVSARRWPQFLGKIELFRVPVLGWYLRGVGVRPLDRSRGDLGALRAAEQILKEGGSLVMFPQGTRGGTTAKAGVGFLAKRAGALVIPARLIGSDRWPGPARLEVRLGAALRFEGDAQAFADKVMETVYSL